MIVKKRIDISSTNCAKQVKQVSQTELKILYSRMLESQEVNRK